MAREGRRPKREVWVWWHRFTPCIESPAFIFRPEKLTLRPATCRSGNGTAGGCDYRNKPGEWVRFVESREGARR